MLFPLQAARARRTLLSVAQSSKLENRTMGTPKKQFRAGHNGPNTKRHRLVCIWCGAEFLAAKSHARCCSSNCRSQLSRYVSRHGCPPLFPFGETLNERVNRGVAPPQALAEAARARKGKGGAK